MSTYIHSISFAILAFPILAAIFTIPYVAVLYHKYGAILVTRVVIVYSFVFYLLCCYFLTMLPLPSIEAVANYTSATMDLIPFHFISEFWENTSFVWADKSTWGLVIHEMHFYEPLFNSIMLIPLGIYLRYYFKCSFGQTLLLGFLLSLSFELIQLSGLFFIYPRPYRLFQVDDLILNTWGAMIGYFLTPLFCFFLPSRDHLDAVSYKRGHRVTYMRRFIAVCVDWVILGGGLALLYRFGFIGGDKGPKQNLMVYVFLVVCYFILLPWIWGGKTPGKAFVGLKLVKTRGGKPALRQYVMRYGIQYLIVLPAPFIEMTILKTLPYLTGGRWLFWLIVGIAFGLLTLYVVGQLLISLLTRETELFYEELSRTVVVSETAQPKTRSGRR